MGKYWLLFDIQRTLATQLLNSLCSAMVENIQQNQRNKNCQRKKKDYYSTETLKEPQGSYKLLKC